MGLSPALASLSAAFLAAAVALGLRAAAPQEAAPRKAARIFCTVLDMPGEDPTPWFVDGPGQWRGERVETRLIEVEDGVARVEVSVGSPGYLSTSWTLALALGTKRPAVEAAGSSWSDVGGELQEFDQVSGTVFLSAPLAKGSTSLVRFHLEAAEREGGVRCAHGGFTLDLRGVK